MRCEVDNWDVKDLCTRCSAVCTVSLEFWYDIVDP